MIDLHMHSIYSDGTCTTKQLVQIANERKMKAISLTDHDTVEGLEEMNIYCKESGIEFINGIEFSTEYFGREIHILGYFVDTLDIDLINKLQYLKEERVERTKEIIKKLNKFKINIDFEEVQDIAESEIISRSHIAMAMYKKGYVYSLKEAFLNYIGNTGAAYIPKKDVDTLNIIELLNKNKALSFLAHPKLINTGEKKLLEMIDIFKEGGLDGIETYYSCFTQKDKVYYSRMARERNMLISGGSDFHGDMREMVKIGDGNAYYEMVSDMKKLIFKKYGKVVD